MRRLKIDQEVALSVDDGSKDHTLRCRVLEVFGSTATLKALNWLERRAGHSSLSPGALSYLVVERRGSFVALRGVARVLDEAERKLEFIAADRFQLPERRVGNRVPVKLKARITSQGGAVAAAVTVNLSGGGALLACSSSEVPDDELSIELTLVPERAAVKFAGRVARRTPKTIAVEFTDIGAEDRVRLAVVLTRHAETLAA
jgi:hypothetical protein